MLIKNKPHKGFVILFYSIFIILLLAPTLLVGYIGCFALGCFITWPLLAGYVFILIAIFSAISYFLWKRTLPKKFFLLSIILPIISFPLFLPIGTVMFRYEQIHNKILYDKLSKEAANIHNVQKTPTDIIYNGKEVGVEFKVPNDGTSVSESYTISSSSDTIPEDLRAEVTILFQGNESRRVTIASNRDPSHLVKIPCMDHKLPFVEEKESLPRDGPKFHITLKGYETKLAGKTACVIEEIRNFKEPSLTGFVGISTNINTSIRTRSRLITINAYMGNDKEEFTNKYNEFLRNLRITD